MPQDALPVWDLVRTAHLVGLRFGELLARTDLTPTQHAVLYTLATDGGMTQADLARAVLVRPQSIGVLAADLVERGLVIRDGPGGRGRRSGLALTEAGRKALERVRPSVQEFNTPTALGLSPAQTAMLQEMLARIRDTLKSAD